MKNILKTLLPIVLALVAVSCKSNQETTRPAENSLLPDKSQTWQLVALNGREIPRNAKTVTLSFNPEAASFRGTTACNTYAGTYTLGSPSPSDGRCSLSISTLESGSLRCPEADINAESRYLSLLQKTNSIFISQHTLTLYQRNKETLRFQLQ